MCPYDTWRIGGTWGWIWYIGVILMGLLILAGMIALVVWLIRGVDRNRGADSPMEILNRRYANGDINKEQYEQMKQDIS